MSKLAAKKSFSGGKMRRMTQNIISMQKDDDAINQKVKKKIAGYAATASIFASFSIFAL